MQNLCWGILVIITTIMKQRCIYCVRIGKIKADLMAVTGTHNIPYRFKRNRGRRFRAFTSGLCSNC